MGARTWLTGLVIKALASDRAICIVLMLARSLVTFVGMSVVIVASVAKPHHVRNAHHHLVNVVAVRVICVSMMHATTQQCVEHYGGHRRVGDEFVKHGRFVKTRATGVVGLVVAVFLSVQLRSVYIEM